MVVHYAVLLLFGLAVTGVSLTYSNSGYDLLIMFQLLCWVIHKGNDKLLAWDQSTVVVMHIDGKKKKKK